MLLAQSDTRTRQTLDADLADVESRFAAELHSDLDCVNHLVSHIESYRGKMLRPTLVLACAHAVDPAAEGPSDAHRTIATVVEMVHMATLVHDDILDEAEVRRQGKTVNQLSGNETAVMLGDYLISHAYHLCSSLGRPELSRLISTATNTTCEGELLQLANRNNWRLDERTYFQIIQRKTASLCGVCCRAAAVLCDTSDAVATALYRYGEHLGVAFQIVDDVLDLTGDEQTVGKTLGRDLEKGKLTLPLIHYIAQSDQQGAEQMINLMRTTADPARPESKRSADINKIRRRLTDGGCVEYARQRAAQLIDRGRSEVCEHLPESPGRRLLLEMAQAVLDREF